MRLLYAERRNLLMESIRKYLGFAAIIIGEQARMHLRVTEGSTIARSRNAPQASISGCCRSRPLICASPHFTDSFWASAARKRKKYLLAYASLLLY